MNRPIKVIDPAATGTGSGGNTQYAYDGLDQLTQVTDPRSLSTTYSVNGLGNLLQQVSPDTGTTNNDNPSGSGYDGAGNLIRSTDARGKVTLYTYDALNRLTKADYASGTDTVFEYDGGSAPLANDRGRLTRIVDESGETRLRYDALGRVIKKTQITGTGTGAQTQIVQFAYGTSGATTGKLIGITYPSGIYIGYSYDAAGQVASIAMTTGVGTASLLSNISYTPFGAPKSWTWGNGSATAAVSIWTDASINTPAGC